jgi:hypothetical protein
VSEGFFSRWSRRKQEAGQEAQGAAGSAASPPPAADGAPGCVRDDAPTDPRGGAADHGKPGHDPQQACAEALSHETLPTLEDVQSLTPESDFQPFMQTGVSGDVRNAAMKKLFADPHFNVMDGLDIYIGDYSQPDPMPQGMLRQMASAQFLKLVPSETPEENRQSAGAAEVVAQSPDASARAELPEHDDPDLQLQPDPAPADPATGSRTR